MRTAFVQLGPDFPPLEAQMALLQRLRPDAYHVEETASIHAAQRIVECLEQLGRGDELCLFSLTALRLEAGEAAELLATLLGRGVRCLSFIPDETLVEIDSQTDPVMLLRLLAEVHRARISSGRVTGPRMPDSARQLLRDDQIEDIRRLARAGVTARRIGLIYRRTPDCIHALLREDSNPAAPVAEEAHRKSNLRKKASR